MSTKNDGGPAFARAESTSHVRYGDTEAQDGMSLRDYFASKAMQGFCANSSHMVTDGQHEFKNAAVAAYLLADAMIAERDK